MESIYLNIGFKRNSVSYHLSEDTPIDTVIDHLNIEYDTFPLFINQERENPFFYTINDTSIPFLLDQNERTMKLTHPLDREKRDQYTFEIDIQLKSSYQIKFQEIYHSQTTNRSLNIQYAKKYYQKMLVTIHIMDINDHIPRCNLFHQRIVFNENQIQTNIFHFQAFDPDRGENGTIIYSLLDYHRYFTINPSTGQIDAIQPLDHEQVSSLRLHIIASDQGQQLQLQSLCLTLHITIIDLNDNIPQFSLANYTFQVFSDLPPGTIFAQIYATDADSVDRLIYSIDDNPYIMIHQHTGHLQLKTPLYYSTNPNLNITVRVFDGLHINETWLYIHLKPFPEAQEPILLPEPAYQIIVNQSTAIGTIITNVYQHFALPASSIDFIEMISDQNRIPLSIDQHGSIRLIESLTDQTNFSYWFSIRLTRYRAHPPHSFLHIHLTIREDNFYLPQCVNIYQHIKLYDYSIPYPLARMQALSYYDHVQLEYSLVNEKIFSIEKQTGLVRLSPTIQIHQLMRTDYLLTVRAVDHTHHLSVDCFLRIHHIQRRQLTPKFYYSSVHQIDLIEIPPNSTRLRQRLFQVIALLDHQVYHQNLQIRYRIVDSQAYFLINRQTGYIAAKSPLKSSSIYRLNIEAYTIAYTGKWRIVSSRVVLAIKIRVLPMSTRDPSLVIPAESIINLDLSTTTKVGSRLFQLGMPNNHSKWFILTSQIEYTRYFHVNLHSGELILLRPMEELINRTTMIELYINITNDWIHLNTIRVIIHLRHNGFGLLHFSQTDYYTSVSKSIPIGIEIARLTVDHFQNNCTYRLHSVERMKSREFFYIHPFSGSITILQSLANSRNENHLLSIIYQCSLTSQLASTRLYINILEKKSHQKNSYRFSQDEYLLVFQISLITEQRKYLMHFELISNDDREERISSDVQIVQGDPLGLFSIDSSNQSLVLLDQSRSRSYTYPIRLTILDTSQEEPINCTVTVFISNIAIQFTCPPSNSSPYLFTYESLPRNTIDVLTGQQYHHSNSLIIRGFDFFTSDNPAECFMLNSEEKLSSKELDFIFEKDLYHYAPNTQQAIHLSIKNRVHFPEPFAITYQIINQTYRNSFQFDPHTGRIEFIPTSNSLIRYSLLILARYHSFITLTRVNVFVNLPKTSFSQFHLFRPVVDNYTIGYLNPRNSNRRISSVFSIDQRGRLFLPNATLLSPIRNFYDLLLDQSRLEIHISSKEVLQCSFQRYHLPYDNPLLGLIQTTSQSRKRSFYLLNYNHLFTLNREHGLLYQRNENQIIEKDLILLIEIENARCFVTINGVLSTPYLMIRKGNDFQNGKVMYSSGRRTVPNGTSITFDLVSSHAPLFSRKFYTFSVDITDTSKRTIFVGQIFAEPYHRNRSCLVYQFLSSTKYFIIDPETGIIEYRSNTYCNQTIERLQIIARDLIYQENTTIDLTIHILRSEEFSLSSLIYHRTISETIPPGSIIFEPNISTTQILYYTLLDSHSHLFTIDSSTGQVTLHDHPSASFYLLKIHLTPVNQRLTLRLIILDSNNHAPNFFNLPFNLTVFPDHSFVTKVSAYDLDLSNNQNLQYYLLDFDQREIFSINQITGIVTFKTPSNQTFFQLKIGVSDGLHLAIAYLPITISDYSKNPPRFSSNEYSFRYNQHLGQISADDLDPNDQISYQLYLEPDGIQIDRHSGSITIHEDLFFPSIEFFASAIDRAQQIAYTKIKIIFPIQPKFLSNLYHLSLSPALKVPLEIFRFQLVDSFNQPLSSTRFEIDPTDFFSINSSKLILKSKVPQSKIFFFNIYGYWRNFTCQTSIQIVFVNTTIRFNQKFYEFSIEKNQLKANYFIHKFDIRNSFLKILSTPLTHKECLRNFYLEYNQLYFRNYPILSNLCFFELQLFNEKSLVTSLVKITFIESDFKPIFSSKIYFYTNQLQVFARSVNRIRYRLQANPYGLMIDPNNGVVSSAYSSDRLQSLDRVRLLVYAIDDKIGLNDTALIEIPSKQKEEFRIPSSISSCPNTPTAISDQSLPGTIIQGIHRVENRSTDYYILSGDTYGLFAINPLGQLYLTSAILNQTTENFFDLILLVSAVSLSYCRTNITIIHTPSWSDYICPPIPIVWTIEEESPIGTRIGNVKDILQMINNNSQLTDRIEMKSNNTEAFHFNSSTGLILSNSRLDYEQETLYSFSILLESVELHCSISIQIQLINIHDTPIILDRKSLTYTINENNLLPFYIGRIRFIDPDPFYSSHYHYYLTNTSSDLFIDSTTGSIILLTNPNRAQLQYELIVIDPLNQKNITDILHIDIDDSVAGVHITDQIHVLSSIIHSDSIYFNFNTIRRCSINENQSNGTKICTIGRDSIHFFYQLIDPMHLFDILSNNGTIINRKIFDYESDLHEFNVTIIVRDRKDQSVILSSMNLTIYLRNVHEEYEDWSTLLYLFYPSMNTIVYTIEEIDPEQSNFTYEIINNTFSSYILRRSSNWIELVLIQSISHNREDNLIIRRWSKNNLFFDIKLRLIYLRNEMNFPTILSHTIDAYLNLENTTSKINLGQIFIHDHEQYQFINFHLIPNQHFSLRQSANNRTELYFHPSDQFSFLKLQINLTAIALTESIPDIDFSKNTKVMFPSITKSQSINIHLWSINQEMVDRTVAFIIDIHTTYEQFIMHNLPILRQTLARMIEVDVQYVHIYTFELRNNRMELLLAILRSTSSRYLHKKFLYNALKNTTQIFDPCQLNSCENNAYCASHVSLLDDQYTYFYSAKYQRVIPKYQWNRKCLCRNSYHGEFCQYPQYTYSPCSSNPCAPGVKCLEQSSTEYSCQCTDGLCNSRDCININSPTCRDSSNSFTFEGDSLIRMNSTSHTTEHLNITFSFRTQSTTGKLLQLIYVDEKTMLDQLILMQIIDGHIRIEWNEEILLQLNEIRVNDGLWHDVHFFIENSYYLLRLDRIFSDRIILSQQIHSDKLLQFIMGTDYYGCLSNLSLNSRMIPLHTQNDHPPIELIGTSRGCQLPDTINDDFCSLYNPCYHGGICTNDERMSFTCNCTNRRFTGRQCQLDLYPCQSYPCRLNEQCIPFSFDSNQSFRCTRVTASTSTILYIGCILAFSLCLFFIVLICYCKKRRERFLQDTPFASAPLLTQKSAKQMDGTMQTLLKSDSRQIQTIEKKSSVETSNRRLNDSRYYTTGEQRNSVIHYGVLQTNDLFDFSSSTKESPGGNDVDLTESSNDSSPIHPHSFFYNYDQIPTSSSSLPKGPIYTSVIKTARVRNMLSSTLTSLIESNELPSGRLRHASDSDLLYGRKSTKLSSFFQTDV